MNGDNTSPTHTLLKSVNPIGYSATDPRQYATAGAAPPYVSNPHMTYAPTPPHMQGVNSYSNQYQPMPPVRPAVQTQCNNITVRKICK